MKWFLIINFLYSAIKTTYIINRIAHVRNMGLASNIWKKFKIFYQNMGFIKCNAIFIYLSTQTYSNFANIAKFANNIKQNPTWLKKIITKNISN